SFVPWALRPLPSPKRPTPWRPSASTSAFSFSGFQFFSFSPQEAIEDEAIGAGGENGTAIVPKETQGMPEHPAAQHFPGAFAGPLRIELRQIDFLAQPGEIRHPARIQVRNPKRIDGRRRLFADADNPAAGQHHAGLFLVERTNHRIEL